MPRKALPRKQAKVDSMQCSMCQHVQGLTLMCVPNSDSASSKWFETGTTCHIQAFSTWHWNRMSCIEALLIEPGFSLPSAFRYKKLGFLPRTPLPPPNEPHNFLCEMAPYIEICYAYGGVSPAEKDSLCGTVMMAWIWHLWINAIVFVPTAKAPPKAAAKELSHNSLNLACSGQHPRFGPNWFVEFCHTWRWIGYA